MAAGYNYKLLIVNYLVLFSYNYVDTAETETETETQDKNKLGNLINEDVLQPSAYVFWRNGTIPFFIEKNHFDSEQTISILTALHQFSSKTCLKFVPVMARPVGKEHVLVLENPSGVRMCSISTEPHSIDDPHFVILGYDCLRSPDIEMMIMKALGFPFEHNRASRDLFIDVQTENVEPGYLELFVKDLKLPIELRMIPYDVNSVMHFGNRAFSSNGHRTILFKKPNIRQQRIGLSPIDLRKINVVYGPECQKRDRLEKMELCQNYPGVARRKRENRSLRVNPNITPAPKDIVPLENDTATTNSTTHVSNQTTNADVNKKVNTSVETVEKNRELLEESVVDHNATEKVKNESVAVVDVHVDEPESRRRRRSPAKELAFELSSSDGSESSDNTDDGHPQKSVERLTRFKKIKKGPTFPTANKKSSKKKKKSDDQPLQESREAQNHKKPRVQENGYSGSEASESGPDEEQGTALPRVVTLSKLNKEFYNERRWPGGIVRYFLEDARESFDIEDVRRRLAEVDSVLRSKTCVRLSELTEATVGKYDDYLVLDSSPDYVTGRVGGRQKFGVTELLRGGEHRQHTAMVVMAMLGFYFEVARHDRDDYIRVHKRHIRPDKLHHFEKLAAEATLPLPYDFKSATHPSWEFWKQIGRTGISTVATYKDMDPDGNLMKSLGQNQQLLSKLDLVKINSVYGIDCFIKKAAKEKKKQKKLQKQQQKERDRERERERGERGLKIAVGEQEGGDKKRKRDQDSEEKEPKRGETKRERDQDSEEREPKREEKKRERDQYSKEREPKRGEKKRERVEPKRGEKKRERDQDREREGGKGDRERGREREEERGDRELDRERDRHRGEREQHKEKERHVKEREQHKGRERHRGEREKERERKRERGGKHVWGGSDQEDEREPEENGRARDKEDNNDNEEKSEGSE